MLIVGKTEGDSRIKNRFLWWMHGWCALLDGIAMVLSLGFYDLNLTYSITKRRLRKRVQKKPLRRSFW